MERTFTLGMHSRTVQALIAPLVVIAAGVLLSGCASAPRPEQGTTFYPPLPEMPRIQFLTSISNEEDIGVERDSLKEFVTGKKQNLKAIARPWDIESGKGNIYVVDKGFSTIWTINLDKKAFAYLEDTGAGALQNPGGLFISSTGSKYLADQGRKEVLVFDSSNRFVKKYEAGEEFRPLDVVVGGDRVYASDINAHEIKIFDLASGELTGAIDGSEGNGGAFHSPTHLAVDSDGNLFVTDFLHFRVQKFDKDGNYVRTMGEEGDFPGAMPRPKGIAVDREQHLYVVDSAFEFVQIFDVVEGNVLLSFGKFGSMNGGTWLPVGIHIDYENLEYFSSYIDPRFQAKYLIYVANQSGPFKINVYAYGDWKGGK